MNTKLLMTLSALMMGIAGIILSFLPHELLGYLSATTGSILDVLIFQILGALYFAFAMVNWNAKGNLIGGIYARPIAVGNVTHFTIGSLALIKGNFSSYQLGIQALTVTYIVFALSFGIVLFRHPVKPKID